MTSREKVIDEGVPVKELRGVYEEMLQDNAVPLEQDESKDEYKWCAGYACFGKTLRVIGSIRVEVRHDL